MQKTNMQETIGNTEIRYWSKEVSVHILFDTDRVGFGNQSLAYFSNKTFGNETMQEKLLEIIAKMKLQREQLTSAIEDLETELA